MEAQLSHVDPSKASATYNHAAYVGPRRQMMQDWADRLDLLEQGYVEQALVPLQIHAGSVVAENSLRSVHRPVTGFAAGCVAGSGSTLVARAAVNMPAGLRTFIAYRVCHKPIKHWRRELIHLYSEAVRLGLKRMKRRTICLAPLLRSLPESRVTRSIEKSRMANCWQ